MRTFSTILLGVNLVFSQLVVCQEPLSESALSVATDDDNNLFAPENGDVNTMFSLLDEQQQYVDHSPLASSTLPLDGMTTDTGAMGDTNFFLASELGAEDDFCDSSSLPGVDVEADFGTGIQARGASCVNPASIPGAASAPAGDGIGMPIFAPLETEEDMRERAAPRDHWCGENQGNPMGKVPCCSVERDEADSVVILESTLRKFSREIFDYRITPACFPLPRHTLCPSSTQFRFSTPTPTRNQSADYSNPTN